MKDKTVSTSRRHFLRAAGAFTAGVATLPLLAIGPALADGMQANSMQSGVAMLRLKPGMPGAKVSEQLIGLSYETLQLRNPDFFSRKNEALIGFLRQLNPHGVLRIGGNTSDFSVWSEYQGKLPVFENKPGVVFKRPYLVTPQQLANLADFLRATGWRLIFGVNLKIDNPEMAAQLAEAVHKAVGEHLLAIQIGNEPNDFPHVGGTYFSYDEYIQAWQRSAQAIRKAVSVPIAGPDTGANTDWVLRFAEQVPDIVAVSRHYYRGGAMDPTTSIAELLSGDPQFFKEAAQISQVAGKRQLPFYLSEANSYWSGGKLGVSNTFASALWGGDFALASAKAGVHGINIHSGMLSVLEASLDKNVDAAAGSGSYKDRLDAISGRYSPIAGDFGLGFYARPLYYGLLLAQQFGGAQFIDTELTANGANLTAYAADKQGRRLVALFNKDLQRDMDLRVELGKTATRAQIWRMQARSLEEVHEVTLAGSEVDKDGHWAPKEVEAAQLAGDHFTIHLPRGSAALAFIEA
ncbi:MAG: hypothetical protein WA777_09720 [Rhodanobacter sp.]